MRQPHCFCMHLKDQNPAGKLPTHLLQAVAQSDVAQLCSVAGAAHSSQVRTRGSGELRLLSHHTQGLPHSGGHQQGQPCRACGNGWRGGGKNNGRCPASQGRPRGAASCVGCNSKARQAVLLLHQRQLSRQTEQAFCPAMRPASPVAAFSSSCTRAIAFCRSAAEGSGREVLPGNAAVAASVRRARLAARYAFCGAGNI